MGMMSSNALLSVTTRREKRTQPDEIIDADVLQSFYRPTGEVRLFPKSKRDTGKNSEHAQLVGQELPLDGAERFRVLLIGKEQRERQAICSTLSQHLDFAVGYLEARNGEIALQMLGREVINLIILEDSIADMDGLEFLGRLNKKFGKSNIPVIAILNSGTTKTGVQAMKMGAHDYLLKDIEGQHFELLPILVARIYTERKMLSSLRQTVSVYQTMTDSVPVVIYKLSLQGGQHDVYISPQFSELGLSADQWGTDAELHHRMCHEEDRPPVIKALKHSYKTGAEFQCEYRINTLKNTLRCFHDEAKVIMDTQGRPLFLQGVMTDITCIKTLEDELTRYRCMQEEMVLERTGIMERRLAILKSCNSTLGENYHKMHQMYLDLLIKTQAHEDEIDGSD